MESRVPVPLLCLLCLLSSIVGVSPAMTAEVIPPAPAHYVNDYAHLLSAGTAQQLEQKLQQFERDTSNQIVVAIFPKMQSESSIEDYTQRVAEKWKVGQKGRNNGAVLFVFVQDRATYIQVGYGLEGPLPDATAKLIIENEIVPRFRSGDFDGGISSAVSGMIAATKGEYKGTGRTAGDRQTQDFGIWPILIFLLVIIVLSALSRARQGYGYSRGGFGNIWIGGMGMGRGRGGGFGGGGFGGGGGFSGGGGSFGGGGAGGRW